MKAFQGNPAQSGGGPKGLNFCEQECGVSVCESEYVSPGRRRWRGTLCSAQRQSRRCGVRSHCLETESPVWREEPLCLVAARPAPGRPVRVRGYIVHACSVTAVLTRTAGRYRFAYITRSRDSARAPAGRSRWGGLCALRLRAGPDQARSGVGEGVPYAGSAWARAVSRASLIAHPSDPDRCARE